MRLPLQGAFALASANRSAGKLQRDVLGRVLAQAPCREQPYMPGWAYAWSGTNVSST
jgi:hypothetical protein